MHTKCCPGNLRKSKQTEFLREFEIDFDGIITRWFKYDRDKL